MNQKTQALSAISLIILVFVVVFVTLPSARTMAERHPFPTTPIGY